MPSDPLVPLPPMVAPVTTAATTTSSDPVLQKMIDAGLDPITAYCQKRTLEIYNKVKRDTQKKGQGKREARSSCISGDEYIRKLAAKEMAAAEKARNTQLRKENAEKKKMLAAALKLQKEEEKMAEKLAMEKPIGQQIREAASPVKK